MKNSISQLTELKEILNFANEYPPSQNERPLYCLNVINKRVEYYRSWYDSIPERSITIEQAVTCHNLSELQSKLGI